MIHLAQVDLRRRLRDVRRFHLQEAVKPKRQQRIRVAKYNDAGAFVAIAIFAQKEQSPIRVAVLFLQEGGSESCPQAT